MPTAIAPGALLRRANEIKPTLVAIRRELHRHPELGFQEHATAALIAGALRDLGIRTQTHVGRTGVVGHIGIDGPVVALRADMDGLPIQEANAVDYASQCPGVMHACGHDAHAACLVGAAMLLQETGVNGQVRLLFQPAEEGLDDEGKSGATRLIEEGALQDVSAVFGLHVDAMYPTGTLALSPGYVLAAMDDFTVAILGKPAHGAQAYFGVDAVLLAAQVICALHTVVGRRIPALESGVISVGTIHGGTKENNLAERVELRGTVRSFDPEIRETLIRELERACGIARTLGGDYGLSLRAGYPALANDPALTTLGRAVAHDLVGPDMTREIKPEMGAEDFAFYTRHVPGCYLLLGTGTPGQPARVPHSPTFDVDEAALPLGAATLAQLAIRYLEEQPRA